MSGVPRVKPEALQKRLDFLLSERAVEQQLSAKMRPGLTPHTVRRDSATRVTMGHSS